MPAIAPRFPLPRRARAAAGAGHRTGSLSMPAPAIPPPARSAAPSLEVEIKLAAGDAALMRRRLSRLGLRLAASRRRERNWLFDDPAGRFRRAGRLLRLRQFGARWCLTAKGPVRPGRHKRRPEIELPLADGEAFRRLCRLLGLRESGYYEKYRTRFRD